MSLTDKGLNCPHKVKICSHCSARTAPVGERVAVWRWNFRRWRSSLTLIIKNAYLIRTDGSVIDGSEGITPTDPAFSTDIADNTAEGLPVFEAELNGDKYYIIPMSGKGLWGPVWGYLSIGSDGSTIYGSEFGHAGETPGLGAEIVNLSFRRQFEGKALIKNNEYKSVAVVKPGNTLADKDYVDGISGGTITSNGVNAMLYESVGLYKDFLLKLNAAQ